MSGDNQDLSAGQILAVSAFLVAIPFAIFFFVRWVFTSKVGAVVGFIVAVFIMVVVMSSPADRVATPAVQVDPIDASAADLERAVREITSRYNSQPSR
jgi:hypothetical protein